MDERGPIDVQRNLGRQSSRRVLISILSGQPTPRGSPRRLNSRIVLWLLLITLWAYAGFCIQSMWAHGEIDNSFELSVSEINISNVLTDDAINMETNGGRGVSNSVVSIKKRSKRSRRGSSSSSRSKRGSKNKILETENSTGVEVQEQVPQTNATYGMLVGPFGSIEDRVVGLSPGKQSGTCDRKSQFARLVLSKTFVLVFHELSMTGAPLSMMELASEILSCGGAVSVVALSRKGGLLPELYRKKIKVVEDKYKLSFKAAMKADLVIAGSAVCASWIEQYLDHSASGSHRLVWWIMENRREYFDRSKRVLNRVNTLVFLSKSQSKRWMTWCEEENIKLKSAPSLVPLSVNDELAFVAGISCSLNTPTFTVEKMLEKRLLLRKLVREEMGVKDSDMLVMALSSINPGKGHLSLVESVHLATNKTLNGSEGKKRNDIKLLIGSVGSKSNKVVYVRSLLGFLSNHSGLQNSVIWTPATTRVASLYAAADVYVINSQGIGETFGRVTIEAMANGIPVLGTDAGGTKEIVEHNVSGLVHPTGHSGTTVLSKHLQYLLKNPSERRRLGLTGSEKVKKMYLKRHMYKMFWQVLYDTMKLK
ncbi:putative glycosyl transferase, family 1, Glycosyl-transferase family 4_5 [Helianthus debilis subsp. tardiflorus]